MNPVPHLVKLEKDIKEEEEERPPKVVKSVPQKGKKYPDDIDQQVSFSFYFSS